MILSTIAAIWKRRNKGLMRGALFVLGEMTGMFCILRTYVTGDAYHKKGRIAYAILRFHCSLAGL